MNSVIQFSIIIIFTFGAFLVEAQTPVDSLKNNQPSYGARLFKFSPYITIGELEEKDGSILLFRIINAPKYIKGFVTQRNIKEGGVYSYSVDPGICSTWGEDTALLLVAIQNVRTDKLKYPNGHYESPDPREWSTLTSDTFLGQIAFYNEVDVPTERENVVLTVPSLHCQEFISKHRADNFSSATFVRELLLDSALTLQNKNSIGVNCFDSHDKGACLQGGMDILTKNTNCVALATTSVENCKFEKAQVIAEMPDKFEAPGEMICKILTNWISAAYCEQSVQ